MDKLLAVIDSLLQHVSGKQVFWVVILLTLLIGLYAVFENRQTFYDSINPSRIEFRDMDHIQLSEDSKRSVRSVTNKSNTIIAIQVVEVNFRRNSRRNAYTYSRDSTFTQKFLDFEERKLADFPLFSDVEQNNKRMIRLINGEFICVPIETTVVSALKISGAQQLCSRAIPPIYGKFAGYVTAYVTKTLTSTEEDQLRILLAGLSQEIYERDLR